MTSTASSNAQANSQAATAVSQATATAIAEVRTALFLHFYTSTRVGRSNTLRPLQHY